MRCPSNARWMRLDAGYVHGISMDFHGLPRTSCWMIRRISMEIPGKPMGIPCAWPGAWRASGRIKRASAGQRGCLVEPAAAIGVVQGPRPRLQSPAFLLRGCVSVFWKTCGPWGAPWPRACVKPQGLLAAHGPIFVSLHASWACCPRASNVHMCSELRVVARGTNRAEGLSQSLG